MLKINYITSKKTRWLTISAVVFAIMAGIIVAWTPAHALSLDQAVASLFSWMLFPILSLLGKLLVAIIDLMIQVAQFNDFISAKPVQIGWVAVRDLCNMFLIVILLIIAWGTVLRIENYHYKRTLPSFIIMAFLINFSKTIAAFFIDVSQVLMKTFTDAFGQATAASLTTGAGLQQILMFGSDIGSSDVSGLEVVGALILGILLISFLLGAVLMVLFILLGRILVLWILVVLSPVAYLGEAFSKLKSIATQWWNQFGNYVTVGPLLAFFLWLAFEVMQSSPGDLTQQLSPTASTDLPIVQPGQTSGIAAAISEISKSRNLMNFIVTVGLLFAATTVANNMKTIGGGLGVRLSQGISGTVARKIAKAPFSAYAWGARKIKAGSLPGRIGKGIELNPVNVYKNIKTGMERKRIREETTGAAFADERLRQGQFLRALGAPSLVDNYAQGLFYSHGIKTAVANKLALPANKKRLKGKEKELERDQAAYIGRRNDILGEASEDDLAYIRKTLVQQDADLARPENQDKLKEMAEEEFIKDYLNRHLYAEKAVKGSDEYRRSNKYRRARGQYGQSADAVEKIRGSISKWEAYRPRDFVGQQLRRAQDAEEAKKYATSNEEELISLFKGAVARGDIASARAILIQAARVGHENEIVKYGISSRNNYYEHFGGNDKYGNKIEGRGFLDEDEMRKLRTELAARGLSNDEIDAQFENKGQAVIKKGDHLPSGQQGMNALIREAFIDRLKTDRQTAYALQNDVSNIAEQNDHWNVGQSIGARSDGELFQRSKLDQHVRVEIEMGKRDFENLQRRSNRLAIMEEHHVDPKDPSKGTYSKLTSYGIKEIAEKWRPIQGLIAKERYSPSRAYHLVKSNLPLLEGAVRERVADISKSELDHEDKLLAYHKRLSEEDQKKYIDESGQVDFAKLREAYVQGTMQEYDKFLETLKRFAGNVQEGEPDERIRDYEQNIRQPFEATREVPDEGEKTIDVSF